MKRQNDNYYTKKAKFTFINLWKNRTMMAHLETINSYMATWWPFFFSLIVSVIAGIRFVELNTIGRRH